MVPPHPVFRVADGRPSAPFPRAIVNVLAFATNFAAVALTGVLACQPEPSFVSRSRDRDAAPRAPSAEPDAGDVRDDAGATTRTLVVFDAIRISSDPDAEYFQRATVPVDFGDEPVSSATLSVELESPCYPFDRWTDESIPDGHAWPRLCDAFDRSFLFSLDDPTRSSAPPGLELVRAITPFGGPLSFEVDLTDIVNGRPGLHDLSVDIQTYGDSEGLVSGAKGEWIVTARVELTYGAPPRAVLSVVPLFFGFEQSATPDTIVFEVPRGTRSSRIEYRATGHGGGPRDLSCLGPAEEFCLRTHTLSVDGAVLSTLQPWRDDCELGCTLTSYQSDTLSIDNYCAENPCGNVESVRAPRAGWCPGSITPPFVFEDPSLTEPGQHELSLAIDRVAEGGSWLLSGVYFAYE
jgi:hypothetical protein